MKKVTNDGGFSPVSGDEVIERRSCSRVMIQNCRHKRKTREAERKQGQFKNNFSKKKRDVREAKYKDYKEEGRCLRRKALRISKGVHGGK